MSSRAIAYDDAWILRNWENYRNWLTLRNEYNRVHETEIGYTTFKAHCNGKLGLNFMYSEEQRQWLIDNYPRLGRVKTAKRFNEVFKANKSVQAIKNQCIKLGLRVDAERRKQIAIENTGRWHPVGEEVPMSHGEIYVKLEEGFVRKKNLVYGDVPSGCSLVHLDGDKTNCSKGNLMPLTREQLAMMTAYRFWSKDATVTKTGVMCCELESMVKRGGDR